MNKDVLTLQELSAYTGLSKSWLYKKSSERKIPAYRPFGKKLYFRKEEIDNWLLQNPIATADELDHQASTYTTTHQS